MRKPAGLYRIYMNVGYDLNEEQLQRYFEKFGVVKDVYLPKHPSGRNRGFGFTTFEDEESLLRSLITQEHIVEGCPVKINRAGPRPANPEGATLPTLGDDGLMHTQSPTHATVNHHQLLQAALQPDPFPLGFGSPPSLGAGLAGLGGQVGHGRGPRIYVGNIPDHLSEDEIRQHFMRWGQVKDIYFPGKRGQKRVNYCFVTFDSAKAAQRACSESERSINGKGGLAINLAEQRSQAPQTTHNGGSSSANGSPILGRSATDLASLGLSGLPHTPAISGFGDYGNGLPSPSAALLDSQARGLQHAAEQQATTEYLLFKMSQGAGGSSSLPTTSDAQALLRQAIAAQSRALAQGQPLQRGLAYGSLPGDRAAQSLGMPLGMLSSHLRNSFSQASSSSYGSVSMPASPGGYSASLAAAAPPAFPAGYDSLGASSYAHNAAISAGYGSLAGGLGHFNGSDSSFDTHFAAPSSSSSLGFVGYGMASNPHDSSQYSMGSMFPGAGGTAGSAAAYGQALGGVHTEYGAAYAGAEDVKVSTSEWIDSQACKVRPPPPYPGSKLVEGF